LYYVLFSIILFSAYKRGSGFKRVKNDRLNLGVILVLLLILIDIFINVIFKLSFSNSVEYFFFVIYIKNIYIFLSVLVLILCVSTVGNIKHNENDNYCFGY